MFQNYAQGFGNFQKDKIAKVSVVYMERLVKRRRNLQTVFNVAEVRKTVFTDELIFNIDVYWNKQNQ